MKKLLLSSLAVAALSLASLSASAAGNSTMETFAVVTNLTPACVVTSSAQTLTFNYVAFGAAVTPSITLTFKCTTGLSVDTGTFDSSGGTLLGLAYTLSKGTKTGPTTSGSQENYSFVINGTMALGQPGTATSTNTATENRTFTIAF